MKKSILKTHREAHRQKKTSLVIILFIGIILFLSINLISADFSFDNVKGDLIIDETTSKYGRIEIRDWFGLFDLVSVEPKINTDICSSSCSAEIEIIMYQDGVLIDDIKFIELINGKWLDSSIQSYNFYIKDGGSKFLVNDYEYSCSKSFTLNLTEKETCSQVKVGEHYENNYTYKPYKLGEEVEEGTYYVRLEGKKYGIQTVDWQITTAGILLDEFEVWAATELKEVLGTSTTDSNINNIGASAWTAYNFTASENYSIRTVQIFVTEDAGLITATHVGLYEVDSSTNQVIPNIIGSNSSTISSFAVDTAFNFTFPTNDSLVVAGRKYALVFWDTLLGGPAIRVGETIETNGRSFTSGGPLSSLDFDTVTTVASVNIRIYGATDITPIATTLNTPIDNFNSTSSEITFNCSTTTTIGHVDNLTLWLNITGNWELNQTIDIPGTETTNTSLFERNIPEGINYQWTCVGVDSFSINHWANNRTFSVDTILPEIIIHNPLSISDFGSLGKEEILNWTVTELNLASIWYNYNGTNFTLNGKINNTIFFLKTAPYNLTMYVNDTNGNTNSSIRNWTYKLFLNNLTFNSTVLETSNQNFILNVSIASGFNIQKASLIYDDIIFTGATISGSGSDFNIEKSITIPQGVQGFSSENRTFVFNITMAEDITGDTSSFLTTGVNQTVNELSFGLCNGANLDVPMLNFTYKDEGTGLEINASNNRTTFQSTFQIGIDQNNLVKNLSINNVSTNFSRFDFCTDETSNSFVTNMALFYTAQGFTDKNYFLSLASLTSVTNEIDLFLINENTGVEFFIDVEQNLFPLTSATISIAKFFIGEGIFRTVEIDLTDGAGRITAFLDLNKDYRFTITKDGELLAIINKRAICEAAPCTLDLSLTEETPDIYSGFSEIFASQVLYNLSFDGATKIVTFEFVDITGLATSFRMDITKGRSNGTGTLISTQRLFTSSGLMTFDASNQTGDLTAKVFIARSPDQLIDFINFVISSVAEALGILGLFVAFLIVITVIMGFALSPRAFIFAIPLSLTLVKLMGIISLSNGAIVVIYLLAIVAATFISR